MQLDSKKKILLMAGALVVLVIGVVLVFVVFKGGGKSDSESTDQANASTPAPTGATPGITPPGAPGAPGMPAGGPSMPMPPIPPAGGAPSAMPGGAPSVPGMPPGMPPGVPGMGAPGMTAPGMGAPGMMAPGMGAPGMPGMTPKRPTSGKLVDPFAGGPGRIKVIDPNKPLPEPPYVPIYDIPMVTTKPAESSTPVAPDTFENPDENTNDDDDFFFGGAPQESITIAKTNLGRTAGWIANETQGRVTAFFEKEDGSFVGVNVGSVVNGMRVKSITKNQMVLLDEKTGYQETIKLQATQRHQATGRTSSVAPSTMPAWGSR